MTSSRRSPRNRPTRLGSTRGFTLIEVLIAVTLLSLLTVGMTMAMRVGLNALERSNGKLMHNRRVAGVRRILDQQIANMIPVVTRCSMEPAGGGKAVFFHGEPGVMRAITTYSLEEAQRGYPRIVDYFVAPSPNGGVRLMVNETPYSGPASIVPLCLGPLTGTTLRLRPVQPGPRSFVLADRLRSCRFQFLKENPMLRQRAWIYQWEGGGPGGPGLPSAVRIEMIPLEADPSRLQFAPMTLAIKANRNAFMEYYDIDPAPQP